jgi:hypothetical protein
MLGGPRGIAVIGKMAALMSKYGTETAVTAVLKSLGKRDVANVFKYVLPFVGSLVASGAGYYLTYNFGAAVVEEYHSMAEELLAECLRRQCLTSACFVYEFGSIGIVAGEPLLTVRAHTIGRRDGPASMPEPVLGAGDRLLRFPSRASDVNRSYRSAAWRNRSGLFVQDAVR